MSNIQSRFAFDSRQRSGVLVLAMCVILSILGNYFLDFSEEEVFNIESPEIVALQCTIDSLKQIALEEQQPKQYPFNPNFLTDYRAYVLGISPRQYDKLKAFREKDQWVNSASDFQRVTGVSDSLLTELSPWFKFPEWVTKPRTSFRKTKKPAPRQGNKKDINTATVEHLTEVYGIGEVLANRIVTYRNRKGGFNHTSQLYDVYGLNESVVERVWDYFEVRDQKPIERFDLNTASASDLATIPGVSYDTARRIWEYRVLRERIDSVSQLAKIEGLSERKIQLIQLYLYIE